MKTKVLLISLFIGLLSVVSCTKNPFEENKEKQTEPFAMVYEDFILPDDIKILTDDTTKISVSTAYLDKMLITDLEGRTTTIWRTIGTVPFVRKIQSAQVENDRVILTTAKAEFSDMFENLDAQLSTDIYINNDYKPVKVTRSGTGAIVDDYSGKYTDENGVIHPAVVIFEPVAEPSISNELITKTGGEKNYFTAEEILSSNFEFNIINVNSNFKFDHKFPQREEDDDSPQIHLMGKVGVSARLSAYFNVKIGFFRLKKFEAGIEGSAGLSAKVGLGVKGKYSKEWENTIANFGKTTVVCWLGPIPVPFTVESRIKQKASGEATATAQILTSANFNTSFETGVKYESGDWRSVGYGSRSSSSFSFDGAEGSAELEASCGVYFETGLFLCGSAGPTLAFGPSIDALAGVTANLNPVEQKFSVEAEYGAYAGLGAEIGAKVKILGYTLGQWNTTVNLLRVTLLRDVYSHTWSIGGWEDYRNNWMNSIR